MYREVYYFKEFKVLVLAFIRLNMQDKHILRTICPYYCLLSMN